MHDLSVLAPWMYFSVCDQEVSEHYTENPGTESQHATVAIHDRRNIGDPVGEIRVVDEGVCLADIPYGDLSEPLQKRLMLMRTRLNAAAVGACSHDMRWYYLGLVSLGWVQNRLSPEDAAWLPGEQKR